MPSHFSCIGFPVPNMQAYWTLARKAAAEGVRMPAPDGSALVRWAPERGPELWTQIDPSGEIIGMTPFFSTGVPSRIAVTGFGEAPEDPMDGWIDGWLEPSEEDEPFSGAFPLRVDLVNYALIRTHLGPVPHVHLAEVIALAHEVDLYPDDAAYLEGQGDIHRLPVQSFVSAAHFGVDDPTALNEATAVASGYVREAQRLTNTLTAASFWWIRVATSGATVNIFVDPEMVPHEPRAGQVLSGGFWILGRLLDATTANGTARTH